MFFECIEGDVGLPPLGSDQVESCLLKMGSLHAILTTSRDLWSPVNVKTCIPLPGDEPSSQEASDFWLDKKVG